jgi:hypothetical protein
MKKDNDPVYPNIRCEMIPQSGYQYHLILETWVRKKKKYSKRYYFMHYFREAIVKGQDELVSMINHFHAEIYRGLILMKINPQLVASEHPWEPIYQLDPNQEPEEERLTKDELKDLRSRDQEARF